MRAKSRGLAGAFVPLVGFLTFLVAGGVAWHYWPRPNICPVDATCNLVGYLGSVDAAFLASTVASIGLCVAVFGSVRLLVKRARLHSE